MQRLFVFLSLLFIAITAVLYHNDFQAFALKHYYANSPTTSELNLESSVEKILLSDGNLDPSGNQAIWFNKTVKTLPLRYEEKLLQPGVGVLGQSTEEKWIEVNLTSQQLFAHEGNRVVYVFPISSGLPWFPTVTGEFRIWAKLLSQRMTGGSKEDGSYYDLPNVPFVQYFHNGYGIHGAYWHNDFGHPRSHGCVNMRLEDAKVLFYWTNPALRSGQSALFGIPPEEGTRVVVHGVTPTQVY